MILQKSKKILIFGGGGHGKVILDILLSAKKEVLGFLDEDESKIGTEIRGFKILGGWKFLEKNREVAVALGIGNNEIRQSIYQKIKELRIEAAQAIHAKAIISLDTKIGEGVVIMPGAVVNSGTVIEDGAVVNTGATVDHDCFLKKFCQVWPGANLAGAIEVGELSYVGTGTSVIQNIKIGKNVMIGAGAAVVQDIPDNVVAAGVPARIIKNK